MPLHGSREWLQAAKAWFPVAAEHGHRVATAPPELQQRDKRKTEGSSFRNCSSTQNAVGAALGALLMFRVRKGTFLKQNVKGGKTSSNCGRKHEKPQTKDHLHLHQHLQQTVPAGLGHQQALAQMRPFQPTALLFLSPAFTGDGWVTKNIVCFLVSTGIKRCTPDPPSNQGTRDICSNAAGSETAHIDP